MNMHTDPNLTAFPCILIQHTHAGVTIIIIKMRVMVSQSTAGLKSTCPQTEVHDRSARISSYKKGSRMFTSRSIKNKTGEDTNIKTLYDNVCTSVYVWQRVLG